MGHAGMAIELRNHLINRKQGRDYEKRHGNRCECTNYHIAFFGIMPLRGQEHACILCSDVNLAYLRQRSIPHLLLALHLLLVLAVADGAWAASACSQGDAVRVWTAPLMARPGEKLEVMSVATGDDLAELLVTDPAGRRTRLAAVRGGGPPWSLRGVLPSPAREQNRGSRLDID